MLFSFSCSYGQGVNYTTDYQPIEFTGRIPAHYLSMMDIENDDPEQETALTAIGNYHLSQLFRKGEIYINDDISKYINSLLQKIKSKNPEVRNRIYVYLCKSQHTDIFSTPSGNIFMSLGLLSKVKDENELAFLIAKEIAHIKNNHPYVAPIKRRNIAHLILTRGSTFLETSNHFSRSIPYKLKSDKEAISLIQNAGFEAENAITVIELLNINNQTQDDGPINYSAIFNTDSVKIDPAFFSSHDPSDDPTIKGFADNFSINNNALLVSPIQSEITIRLDSLAKFINKLNQSTITSLQSDSLFREIHTITQFEMVELTFNQTNYIKSLVVISKLAGQYPENIYLKAKLIENLYALYYFKSIWKVTALIDERNTGHNYIAIGNMIKRVPTKDLLVLCYEHIKELYNNNNENGELIILMAKIDETKYNIAHAKPFYQAYRKQFSNGKHSEFARAKMLSLLEEQSQ